MMLTKNLLDAKQVKNLQSIETYCAYVDLVITMLARSNALNY